MTSENTYKNVQIQDNDELPQKELEPPKGLGVRHVQALILFLSLTIGYSMRAQLGVSLVAMTINEKSTELVFNISDTNNDTMKQIVEGPDYLSEDHAGWSVYRKYKWSRAVQEMIIFSFFLGYTVMQTPMALLAQRFGGQPTIMVALGANGVLSILTPWMPLMGGWVAVCICRLIQGLTQAAFFPGIHTLLGKWAPNTERGRLSTYIYTGSSFGTIVGFQIAGLFASSPSLGWPATFWACGLASLICLALNYWLGASSPAEHSSISFEEQQYIENSGSADAKSTKRKTPWRQIFTSKAVLGLFCTHIGSGFGYIMIMTQIPLYMSNVLKVDIKNNGLLSSLPYLAMYFMTLLFGYLSDMLINKKIMSIKNVRRTFNTIGTSISIAFLVAFSFVQSTTAAVLLLVLTVSLHAGVHVGFNINIIDLAPNFAGTLMSIGNTLCNLAILLCPVIVSNIVKEDVSNQSKWQIVFIITALFQSLTNAVFLVFIKDDVQSWNFSGTDDDYEEVPTKESQRTDAIILSEKVHKS